MIEPTELQKLKNDYPDFFSTTPPELIDFILSDTTSEKIADIAIKNGVDDAQKVEGIAQRITWVLLNKLPSKNLAMTFELGLGLAPETAKAIADEANQFISSAITKPKPIETVLPKKVLPKETIKEDLTQKPTTVSENQIKPSAKDAYREPTE